MTIMSFTVHSWTVLFVILFLSFTSASVDLRSVSQEICAGSYASFECNVTGNQLIWRYNRTSIAGYTASFNNSKIVGPYNTELVSSNNGVLLSVANTTNPVNSSLDGTTIECRNTTGITSATVSESLTLDVKSSVAATSIIPEFFGDGIRFTWSGATCIPSYRLSVYLSVYKVIVENVAGTTYDFIPETSGDYIFELTSIDYLGSDVNSTNSTPIAWKEPKFFIDITVNNSFANFTFKNGDDERPPVTDCSITFDGVLKSCVINSNIAIFSISSGVRHSYNIIISNVVGTVNMNGELSNEVQNRTIEVSASIDPVVIAAPPAVLGILIILIGFWMVLRIFWKRQCCCPRIWRSSFWLIFFCYDCCTYDTEAEKEKNTIGLNNPNVGEEKRNDTSL